MNNKTKINYFNYGYVRCSAISPKLSLAKPLENAINIIKISKEEEKKESFIHLFPELCLTGYTCEDLFFSDDLLKENKEAMKFIITESRNINALIVVGHPYQAPDGKLYNCASAIHKGKILAMIPKSYLPSYNEFYEARFWTSGIGVNYAIHDFNQSFILAPQQLLNFDNQLTIGIEICEDLWGLNPPSVNMALNGANIILNLSASNELVGKHSYRKELVNQQSARLNCVYIYASAGAMESSKDVVFGGACLISENGSLLNEGKRFSLENEVTNADIDLQKLSMERRKNTTFRNSKKIEDIPISFHSLEYSLSELKRSYAKNPFIPNDPASLAERSTEIIQIQTTGLARKLISTGNAKVIIGLSGGLDSTLTLLISLEAMKKLNRPSTDIICVSMPGFGTSERTKNQARVLAKVAGVTFHEIDITKTVKEHFNDIGHSHDDFSVTFENAQARERTQILLDLGNKENAIMVAGSDLSELFTGWMSYGGDHLFHYGVNVSVPKTLVQHLIKYYKDNIVEGEFSQVLDNVLSTKISPELLPLDKQGDIEQSTEDVLGPYIVIDFFLYHFLRNGFGLDKILHLGALTFKENFTEEQLRKWMEGALRRFKKSQFKRTMSAPGCKVGGCSLSPRGDARYPDEL